MKTMKDLKFFSKEWFTNYWFYYKIHTIVSVIALALIIGTVVEVVTRVKPDLDFCIAGEFILSEEDDAKLKTKIENTISDVNKDGQKVVQFLEINATSQPKDQMQMASREKLFLEFAAGDSYIFLMSKDLFDFYNNQDIFDTKTLCIETKNSEFFADTPFKNSNYILTVRHKRQNEKADFTTANEFLTQFKGE